MNNSTFEMQADFYKAMGNATRLQILYSLRERSMKVGDIVHVTGLSQSIVSRQLSTLRSVGLVKFRRQGNEMIYRIADENTGKICDLVGKILSTQVQRRSEAFEQGMP